jgi:hypothetical protein
MSGNRDGYFREWYEENRGDLLAKRRSRYNSDPDYAEKCREASRLYRQKKKTQKAENGVSSSDGEIVRERRPVHLMINGTSYNGWTIGHLARRLNRSVPTINHWSKHGLLPDTPLKTESGDRLYTDAMIFVVKKALLSRGRITKDDFSFRDEIVGGWNKLDLMT